MEPDQYQQAWKADSARTRVTIDADLLAKEVQHSQQGFRSMIFWRDVREAGTAMLLIPVWFAMGISGSLPWTWYLTVPALMGIVGFILVDRKRHPQRPSEPGEPLLFYVKESLTQVEHQIWLLRNVFWWYLLPFCLSIMAFFLQVTWTSSNSWWAFFISVGFLGLFLFVIYGAVYLVNQRAVRTQLEPRRQDLMRLVSSLEDETNEDSGDVIDFVSWLADPVSNCGLNSSWVANWNLLVPSWRTAAAIILPTLVGALCGLYSGLRFRIPEMGPIFFQTVVGAVIPFEIALGCAWHWSRKKQKPSASADGEPNASVVGVDFDQSAKQKAKRLPGAPAILILVLTLFLGIVAVLAVCSFSAMQTLRRGLQLNQTGLHDLSPMDSASRSVLERLQSPFTTLVPAMSGGLATCFNASGIRTLHHEAMVSR